MVTTLLPHFTILLTSENKHFASVLHLVGFYLHLVGFYLQLFGFYLQIVEFYLHMCGKWKL